MTRSRITGYQGSSLRHEGRQLGSTIEIPAVAKNLFARSRQVSPQGMPRDSGSASTSQVRRIIPGSTPTKPSMKDESSKRAVSKHSTRMIQTKSIAKSMMVRNTLHCRALCSLVPSLCLGSDQGRSSDLPLSHREDQILDTSLKAGYQKTEFQMMSLYSQNTVMQKLPETTLQTVTTQRVTVTIVVPQSE